MRSSVYRKPGTSDMTLKQKAELVSEMMPGHTLNLQGEVVPVSLCPLCGQAVDWTPTHDIQVDGGWVKVHRLCPVGGK